MRVSMVHTEMGSDGVLSYITSLRNQGNFKTKLFLMFLLPRARIWLNAATAMAFTLVLRNVSSEHVKELREVSIEPLIVKFGAKLAKIRHNLWRGTNKGGGDDVQLLRSDWCGYSSQHRGKHVIEILASG